MGKTPFLLTYKTETVIPAEISCPSYRVLHLFMYIKNNRLKANLDLIKKAWHIVVMINETCRHWAAQYHNARVKNMCFKVWDMVLRKLEVTWNVKGREKLAPKWDDPFKVAWIITANTYHL
jgi:hypothetical protein